MNLILGTAVGYEIEQVSTFVKSLRTFNKEADVYLITSSPSDELLKFLNSYGIKTLNLELIDNKVIHIGNSRFFAYSDFLDSFEYDKILLTDVSDVYFQADPFSDTPEDFIWFAENDCHSKFKNDHFLSMYIETMYGKEVVAKLNDKSSLSVGTTIGSYENVRTYVKHMKTELKKCFHKNPATCVHKIDSGIHNYVANFLIKNKESKFNGEHFGTLKLTILLNSFAIAISHTLEVNLYNNFPKIIHQYKNSEYLTRVDEIYK